MSILRYFLEAKKKQKAKNKKRTPVFQRPKKLEGQEVEPVTI